MRGAGSIGRRALLRIGAKEEQVKKDWRDVFFRGG